MCKQCELKPVYEFTNKRKVCKICFIKYFQKKALYTIRKFSMIKKGDVVGYKSKKNFRDVVLEDILKMYAKKGIVELKKGLFQPNLHSQVRDTDSNLLIKSKSVSSLKKSRKVQDKFSNKIALSSSTDEVANNIIENLIKKNLKTTKTLPVEGKIIKPLYLFLEKEVLLYAKLKKLKFKKIKTKTNKTQEFINTLETKHPEIKRAILNSLINFKPE